MDEDILQQLGQAVPEEQPEEIKVPDKKKSSGKTIDAEILQQLMSNGDNSKGMFEPNEDELLEENEKAHEDQDEDVKIKTKGKAEPSKKYEKEFQKDMIKNPENYYINTPKGEMTVKEAIQKGYNPITKRFNNASTNKKEQVLSQLNNKDRAAVEKLFDPSQVGLAPADARAMGLKPDSPMIAQQSPEEQAMVQAPAAMPQQVAAGQPDITQLLGGNL